MLRHDDGQPMTAKQVIDMAWNQFGASAIVQEIAARIAWNAKFESPYRAECLSKDGELMAMIAERLDRWEKEDAKKTAGVK